RARRGLQFKQSRRRFLSRFDSRLMIGVDVDQRAVKANRAFVERDQRADAERVRLWNAHRDRFASFFVKRGPRPAEKSVQIISAGYAGLNIEGRAVAILRDFNEGDKKIQDAVAQLLNVRVLVSRALVSVNRDSLINSFSIEVLLLA